MLKVALLKLSRHYFQLHFILSLVLLLEDSQHLTLADICRNGNAEPESSQQECLFALLPSILDALT